MRGLRLKANMSQEAFGKAVGVTKRSVINYEQGKSFPKDASVYAKISEQFGASVDFLISGEDEFAAKAYADGGSREKHRAEALIAEASALFAGGSLSQEDKDAVIMALQEAYWIAKYDNKKFTPKSKRKK